MADNKRRSNGKDKAFRRPRKKVCQFCADKSLEIDYKNVEQLKRHRLDVPQVTELAWELKKAGMPLPDGILTIEEFTKEMKKIFR